MKGIPFSKLSHQEDLKESAKIIIQTDELRQLKPTPIDEAINNLFYIDKVVYKEIPKLNLFIKEVLGANNSGDLFSQKIGTWIGGDRDGNPNVNHKLTTEIIEIQYKRNKNRIINEIKNLIEGLSQSIHIVSFSKELGEFINKNINILKNDESVKKYDEEPYRLSLSIILKKFLNGHYDIESIINDLNLVLNSLNENRGD